MNKKIAMNGKMIVNYYDAKNKKYVKNYRYRINRDSLRDAYFVSTQHNESIITEFINVIAELKAELEIYSEQYSDKTKEIVQYADDIIAAYLDVVDENTRHERYLKEELNE